MSWHYRILRHPDGTLALHEVYCDETGRPNHYTEQPISFAVEADEGADALAQALRRALDDAINRPILDTESFVTEGETTPENPHLGSSFEEFLREEGIADEVNAGAIDQLEAVRAKIDQAINNPVRLTPEQVRQRLDRLNRRPRTDRDRPQMDENEHHKEVYAYFGLAMFTAQVLEHAIVSALVLCDLIPNRRAKVPSQEAWSVEVDQFMDGHFENTIARLIKAFRKVTTVPDELEQALEQSLKMRNFLAHHYFRERYTVWLTEEGWNSMIVELQGARELFQKTDRLIEEVVEPLRRRYGFTEEALNRVYEEYRTEALKQAKG